MSDASDDDPDFPRSVYELLDCARNRPGMYGTGKYFGGKSFQTLMAFVSALAWGRLPAGKPSLWDFDLWAGVILDDAESSFPLRKLATEFADDAAYDKWFELLDEYRKCTEVELARLPGSMSGRKEWGTYIAADGSETDVEPADWIVIGQFPPSEVYFLAEVRGGKAMKMHQWRSSLEQAYEEAYREWLVDSYHWQVDRR